jgi:histidinol dehydrogenase
MKTFKNPSRSTWESILERPVFDTSNLYETVQQIIDEVKLRGDKALKKYTKEFDKIDIQHFAVSPVDIAASKFEVSDQLKMQ